MFLTKVFGCMKVALFGLFLFGVGLVICIVTSTFLHLTIGYGVVSSIGMGMKFAAETFAVNQYFDKKRAMANSIFLAGEPLGYLVAAPILSLVLERFGLSMLHFKSKWELWHSMGFFTLQSSKCLFMTMGEEKMEPNHHNQQ